MPPNPGAWDNITLRDWLIVMGIAIVIVLLIGGLYYVII